MSKVTTTDNDAMLNAMRHNLNCGFHLEQVESTPIPPKPKRKPGLDYYDNQGAKSSRIALTMALHGR